MPWVSEFETITENGVTHVQQRPVGGGTPVRMVETRFGSLACEIWVDDGTDERPEWDGDWGRVEILRV